MRSARASVTPSRNRRGRPHAPRPRLRTARSDTGRTPVNRPEAPPAPKAPPAPEARPLALTLALAAASAPAFAQSSVSITSTPANGTHYVAGEAITTRLTIPQLNSGKRHRQLS